MKEVSVFHQATDDVSKSFACNRRTDDEKVKWHREADVAEAVQRAALSNCQKRSSTITLLGVTSIGDCLVLLLISIFHSNLSI